MLKGSCLCQAVRYEVDRLDQPIGHCHCVSCRKAHAAAFNTYAGVDRPNFRWAAGAEKLSSYESSPGKLRHFCSICGTQLMAEHLTDPHVIVRVATLDDDPGARPAMHIFTSQAAPWLTDPVDVARYPGWPPGE